MCGTQAALVTGKHASKYWNSALLGLCSASKVEQDTAGRFRTRGLWGRTAWSIRRRARRMAGRGFMFTVEIGWPVICGRTLEASDGQPRRQFPQTFNGCQRDFQLVARAWKTSWFFKLIHHADDLRYRSQGEVPL